MKKRGGLLFRHFSLNWEKSLFQKLHQTCCYLSLSRLGPCAQQQERNRIPINSLSVMYLASDRPLLPFHEFILTSVGWNQMRPYPRTREFPGRLGKTALKPGWSLCI